MGRRRARRAHRRGREFGTAGDDAANGAAAGPGQFLVAGGSGRNYWAFVVDSALGVLWSGRDHNTTSSEGQSIFLDVVGAVPGERALWFGVEQGSLGTDAVFYRASSSAFGNGARGVLFGPSSVLQAFTAGARDEEGGLLAAGYRDDGAAIELLVTRVFADGATRVLRGSIEESGSSLLAFAAQRVPGEDAWIVAGRHERAGGGSDPYALKLVENGDPGPGGVSVAWEARFGVDAARLGGGDTSGITGAAVVDDEVVFTSYTIATGGDADAWLFAVALADGSPRWQRVIGDSGDEQLLDVAAVDDAFGRGVVVGHANNDGWAARVALRGDGSVPAGEDPDAVFTVTAQDAQSPDVFQSEGIGFIDAAIIEGSVSAASPAPGPSLD